MSMKPLIAPEQLISLMSEMLRNAELYRETGGVHTSALCDQNGIISMGEDIGRHNTIDKIIGECLFRGFETKDKILLTSGRIASEMVRKAALIGVPIIASLTSPTERALQMAREMNMTVVGYARGGRMKVYCGRERFM